MRNNTVIITDRLRLSSSMIPKSLIKERYDVELFDDTKCSKCENKPDRSPDNELCATCPAFKGAYRFYSTAEYKKDKVWSLPQADEHAIRALLTKKKVPFKWIDKRVVHNMRHPVKFTGKLYTKGDLDDWGNPRPDQVKALAKWAEKGVGVIQAPARSGKTAIATAAYCEKKVRTVIIANQKELLNQFYETACGVPAPRFLRGKMVASSNAAGRRKMTNIPRLQEKYGKQIIFMPQSFSHLLKYIKTHKEVPDILLITYQSFARDLSRVAKILNKYYSLSIIDEEHGAAADAYLKFAASLHMKYRLGLSATPDRKDMRSQLTKLIYGSVVARIRTTTLRPEIFFKKSAAVPKTKHKSWTGAFKWIVHNPVRNVEIVKQVFADLRKGHNAIIVPVDYKSHALHLVKMINHQAKVNARKKDEDWPTDLARVFHAGIKDRLGTLNWVDKDDKHCVHKKLPTNSPRVLVAVRSMVKQGLDMSRPSMIYIVMPMSAKKGVGAPMFQQLSMRVATPFVGKPSPAVRIWVDNVSFFGSCCAGLLYNEIVPRSNLDKMNKHPQYIVSKDTYAGAKSMIGAVMSEKVQQTGKGFW